MNAVGPYLLACGRCYISLEKCYIWCYIFEKCCFFLKKLGFYDFRNAKKWGKLGNSVTAV